MTNEVRTVFGLSAASWGLVAFLVCVISICAHELGCYLASLAAEQLKGAPDDRPSSLPAYRVEAHHARTGVWDR